VYSRDTGRGNSRWGGCSRGGSRAACRHPCAPAPTDARRKQDAWKDAALHKELNESLTANQARAPLRCGLKLKIACGPVRTAHEPFAWRRAASCAVQAPREACRGGGCRGSCRVLSRRQGARTPQPLYESRISRSRCGQRAAGGQGGPRRTAAGSEIDGPASPLPADCTSDFTRRVTFQADRFGTQVKDLMFFLEAQKTIEVRACRRRRRRARARPAAQDSCGCVHAGRAGALDLNRNDVATVLKGAYARPS
jgi:hypothetical protein